MNVIFIFAFFLIGTGVYRMNNQQYPMSYYLAPSFEMCLILSGVIMILLYFFFLFLQPIDKEEWDKISRPFNRPFFLAGITWEIMTNMNISILSHVLRTLCECITMTIVCKITLYITGDITKRSLVRLFFAIFVFYLPVMFFLAIHIKTFAGDHYTILQYECIYAIIIIAVLLLLKQTKIVLIRTNIFDYNVNIVTLIMATIRSLLCIIEIIQNYQEHHLQLMTFVHLLNQLLIVYHQSYQIHSYRCFIRFDETLFETEDNICAICYEHTQSGVKLGCNHIFHKQCLIDWVFKISRCPLCQKSLRKKSSRQEELEMIHSWEITERYHHVIVVDKKDNNNDEMEEFVNEN